VFCTTQQVRGSHIRALLGYHHFELSRSAAADDYVWKEETSVAGTRFQLGKKPLKKNSKRDWDSIRELAKSGDIESIDAGTYVCHYRTLKAIAVDHLKPVAVERQVVVYWGPTGTGKSRRAWHEASLQAYPKDPRSKFWDGYRGQTNVVFDEFRGSIDISHLLRWFDRYPVIVEVKGSSTVLSAQKIWITSNLHPYSWYPELDTATYNALLRRITIVEMTESWTPPE